MVIFPLKMVIFPLTMVIFPLNMVIFHRFLYVYQARDLIFRPKHGPKKRLRRLPADLGKYLGPAGGQSQSLAVQQPLRALVAMVSH